jgi:Ni/Co efflux regulator RcnB
MKIQKLIVAVAVFAATASAYAQQTEFVAPDAGVKSTLTRAEVRQEMLEAYRNRELVQQKYTGQDPVYAKGQRSREEVRAEAAKAARQFQAGDVTNPYFG